MSQLDLSQAKSLQAPEDPNAKICHRTMALVPMQGAIPGTMSGALLNSPCLGDKCSLWLPEKNKCADAVTERA